jgi:hypothetical protein
MMAFNIDDYSPHVSPARISLPDRHVLEPLRDVMLLSFPDRGPSPDDPRPSSRYSRVLDVSGNVEFPQHLIAKMMALARESV